MKRLFLVPVGLLVVALAASAGGQSLGDLARKEERRRKDVKKPAKVYTNKDLGQVEPAPAPIVPPATASPTDPAADGKKPEVAAGPTEEDQRAASQEQWRTRMAEARTQLERSKMYAEALQTRANSLWADFTARDDPAQRSVIETDRKKTLSELDRVKSDIESQTKAVAELEDEARRAGVPPGWLR
jgi:hypothetical protein